MNNPPNNPQAPTASGWPHGYRPNPSQQAISNDQLLAHRLFVINNIEQAKRQQPQYHVQQQSNRTSPSGVHLSYRAGQIPSPTSPHFPGAARTPYQQMPLNTQQNPTRWIMADPRSASQMINASTASTNSPVTLVSNIPQTQLTPNTSTRPQSLPSPRIQSPVQSQQHPPNTPEQVLVFQRNNKRLGQLAQEMETEAMFGPACDEFKDWLQDVRAYHISNEAAIMKCSAIVRKNMSYGPWSSMCIFQTLYKFRFYLTEGSQRAIATWYNEVCASVTGNSQPTSAHSSPISANVPAFSQSQLQQSPQQQPSYYLPSMVIPQQIAVTQLPIAPQQPVITQPAINIPITTIPVAITAPSATQNIAARSLPHTNLQPSSPYQYLYRVEYAITPFRLQHKKVETVLPFFIGRDNFARIWRQAAQQGGERVPISYVLIAWRNGTSDAKCEWPETIDIEINGKHPKLAKRVKVRVPGRSDNVFQWSGKDKPADLAMYLKEGKNELMIRQLDCACCYWFSIQVFVRVTEAAIVNRIMAQVLHIDAGRNIISKLLGKNDSKEDDEIEVLQPVVRISLKCPVSLMRIKTPVKGKHCKHPECFDLHSYLAISVENPKWRCPICNIYIPPDTIFRDSLSEKLLKEVDKNVCEVEYTEDCDHYRISKSDNMEEEESTYEAKNVLVPGTSECKTIGDVVPAPVKTEAQSENVISLISDDEDEGEARSHSMIRKRTSDDGRKEETSTTSSSTTDKRAKLDDGTDGDRHSSHFAPDDIFSRITAFASGDFADTTPSSSTR